MFVIVPATTSGHGNIIFSRLYYSVFLYFCIVFVILPAVSWGHGKSYLLCIVEPDMWGHGNIVAWCAAQEISNCL